MRTLLLVLLICPMLAAAGPVRGQDGMDPALRAFVASDDYERIVVGAALEADETLMPECGDRRAKTREFLTELERVVFANDRAAPVEGRWLERVEIDRCGQAAYQTVMFTIDEASTMNLQPLLAGQTRVLDPQTQLEVARAVYGSDLRQEDGCTERRIVDTRIATLPVGSRGTWVEHWFVDACGEIRPHSVTMSRQPGGGLRFAAEPAR